MSGELKWFHLVAVAGELCIPTAQAVRLLAQSGKYKHGKWTIADVIGFGATTAEIQARISEQEKS